MAKTFKRYSRVSNADAIFPSVHVRDRDTDLFINYNVEDKLELIASRVYNDPSLWWIIMAANPEYDMEYQIEPGETIRIPMPLNDVIREIKGQL